MNETAEVASNIPIIVLLSLWWAFLSTLNLLFTPGETGTEGPDATTPDGDAKAVADDPNFPELRALDPAFTAEAFLAGARRAYEAVLHAYALGDLKTLQPLLSPEVLAAFTDTCAARTERRETLELTFIGIESAEIVNAATSPGAMEITVHFRAQIVSAERSADGNVVSGHPAAVAVTNDLWTFSRPVPVTSSAWVVIATDEALETV